MTSEARAKVLERLRNPPNNLPLEAAEDCLDRAEQYFLERSGRADIPNRAALLLADIAAALFRQDTHPNDQQVASIKRGDTTVQYQEGGDTAALNTSLEDRIARFRTGVLR